MSNNLEQLMGSDLIPAKVKPTSQTSPSCESKQAYMIQSLLKVRFENDVDPKFNLTLFSHLPLYIMAMLTNLTALRQCNELVILVVIKLH